MQKYRYIAVNLRKQRIKGTFIANDERDLAAQLAKQKLYLVSAKQYSGNNLYAFFTLGTGKVPLKDLTTFCRQFAIMINTGIPILECIDILRDQSFSAYFKRILNVIYDDVKSGLVLSQALNKHSKVFPDFFQSMIYVGEMSGKLDTVFTSLADYYEKDSTIKRKFKSAISYPLMLFGMTIGILILMLALVVPTFKDALASLKVEATGITRVIYDISDFLIAYWQYLLAGVFLVGVMIAVVLMTEKGKYLCDMLKLKLPIVKTVTLNMITARFARGFGLLLSSGMDLNTAMDTIEIVIGNRYLRRRFHDAAESIRHGMSLTVAFESYKLFPPVMIQMITVGEKTASLDEILNRSCVFFDALVEDALSSMISKLGSIMLIIMGAIIGTLFIAVYSPMLSIMNGLA